MAIFFSFFIFSHLLLLSAYPIPLRGLSAQKRRRTEALLPDMVHV